VSAAAVQPTIGARPARPALGALAAMLFGLIADAAFTGRIVAPAAEEQLKAR
jgi:hypothetical protein